MPTLGLERSGVCSSAHAPTVTLRNGVSCPDVRQRTDGIGHYWGYRNYPVEDASTNIVPWGILIGGEEFHHNHHAYPSSAKLSSVWYEFDIGRMYIRLLEMLGLAEVRRIAPVPRFSPGKTECDADTVKAIITHRYYVLAQYTCSVKDACRQEIRRLKQTAATASGERMTRARREPCCAGCGCTRLGTYSLRGEMQTIIEQVPEAAGKVST